MITAVILFTTAALIVISLLSLVNVFALPRLPRSGVASDAVPLVSIMIPARNEAAVIADTLRRWLAQDYPRLEILVLDDQSDDGTGDIVQGFAGEHNAVRLLRGEDLPPGWMGKNWACHQMQQAANGEILLFTDADVRWAPAGLSSLVSAQQRTGADLYTVWPTQQTFTPAERLTVPLMALVVLGYLPVVGTHYLPLAAFGAANGQCMAWRRSAYDRVGGHAAVRDNVLEDVTLARMCKAQGLRLRMADGNGLIACRMYNNWPAVRDGFAKNILAGYGNSVPALLAATLFHWLLFLWPWAWLILGANWATPAPYPAGPLLLIALGLLVRALSAAHTRQRLVDALLLPLSVLLMTRIAFQAIYWHYRFGGPRWKGRIIKNANEAA